jgi:hypothetical protein
MYFSKIYKSHEKEGPLSVRGNKSQVKFKYLKVEDQNRTIGHLKYLRDKITLNQRFNNERTKVCIVLQRQKHN